MANHHKAFYQYDTNGAFQVTDYLLKRGFTKTEHVFRQESSHLGPDGRPIHTRIEDKGPSRYRHAINILKDWIEGNLDIYKASRLLPRRHVLI